jgi:hypothetical protein
MECLVIGTKHCPAGLDGELRCRRSGNRRSDGCDSARSDERGLQQLKLLLLAASSSHEREEASVGWTGQGWEGDATNTRKPAVACLWGDKWVGGKIAVI